jgi:hypothetical protein
MVNPRIYVFIGNRPGVLLVTALVVSPATVCERTQFRRNSRRDDGEK